MRTPLVRPLTGDDMAAAEALLDEVLAGRLQVRLNESVDVLDLPGVGAWDGGRLIGVATYALPGATGGAGHRSELAALAVHPDRRGRGVGAALVEAAAGAARARGAGTMWLVTTNDNLDALRLYQRHGFRLSELRPGAIDRARFTKPGIPAVGAHGIPLRDELVLEREL